jgi:ATP-dependent DNA helicase RecQ
MVALTASATPRVKEDILAHLGLREPSVFQKSFARPNLSYQVIEAEDKLYHLSLILKRHQQPAIVYVRNRKACGDIAASLRALGFTATHYHGGLPASEKTRNMEAWMDEKAQAMIATSAFGMGIDKANVQTVVHVHLPENLESYYQETGRAGRNGKDAFAYLVVGPGDVRAAQSQFLDVLPDRRFLLAIYIKLCNFLQIAYGEGQEETFGFNMGHFCVQYGFPAARAFQALQFLDRQGVLTLAAETDQKVSLQFTAAPKEFVRHISLHPETGAALEAIMRTYPGIFEMRTAVDVARIEKKSGVAAEKIHGLLAQLERVEMIDQTKQHHDTSVTFHEMREDDRTINRVSKYLESQNRNKQQQFHAVVDFITDRASCLNTKLLAYFGEKAKERCGICSNCARPRTTPTPELSEQIIALLRQRPLDSRELHAATQQAHEAVTGALQLLLEEERIAIKPNNRYTII